LVGKTEGHSSHHKPFSTLSPISFPRARGAGASDAMIRERGTTWIAARGSPPGRHCAMHCCSCSARKSARRPKRCRRPPGTSGRRESCDIHADRGRLRLSSTTYGRGRLIL
jgi:hypothetical protein